MRQLILVSAIGITLGFVACSGGGDSTPGGESSGAANGSGGDEGNGAGAEGSGASSSNSGGSDNGAGASGATDAGGEGSGAASNGSGGDASNSSGGSESNGAGGSESNGAGGSPPVCDNVLTIKNELAWCDVKVGDLDFSTASTITTCVDADEEVTLIAKAASGTFELGDAPWHHTSDDSGAGEAGERDGMDEDETSTVETVVPAGGTCIWVCCPFASDGHGCEPDKDDCD
jgi:hypothetical protein